MQNKEKVLEKFYELYYRALGDKKKEFLSVNYKNCKYNKRHRVKGNSKVGFCNNLFVINKIKDNIFVCNDEYTASRCKYYSCINDEESVNKMFYDELKSPSICGFKYPKLAVLLWFLQEIPEEESGNRFLRFKNIVVSIIKSVYNLFIFKWW